MLDYWTKSSVDAASDPNANIEWVDDAQPYRALQLAVAEGSVSQENIRRMVSECLQGFAISMLTALDGGTALAEKGRLFVVDQDGNKIGEGLHAEFVGYLISTGRL